MILNTKLKRILLAYGQWCRSGRLFKTWISGKKDEITSKMHLFKAEVANLASAKHSHSSSLVKSYKHGMLLDQTTPIIASLLIWKSNSGAKHSVSCLSLKDWWMQLHYLGENQNFKGTLNKILQGFGTVQKKDPKTQFTSSKAVD